MVLPHEATKVLLILVLHFDGLRDAEPVEFWWPRAKPLADFDARFSRIEIWWPRAESNHRHKDFQSSALPTELLGHLKTFTSFRDTRILASARATAL